MHFRGTSVLPILVIFSCGRASPPVPAGVDAAVAPMPPPGVGGAAGPTSTDAGTTTTTGAAASASASVAKVDAGDPGTLPQTRDKPPATSPALDARAQTLWDAIVHDDGERGLPFFFPVTAYEQVKAISYPASDWRRRLVAAYKRDISGLHKRLGDKAESAKLVRLEIPDDRARWVEPNEESNKLGYWRVYGTRIIYEVDGKERSFEVSSLISWRGEWYVVHLTGFK
jgi:hypothetical protein